MINVIRYAGPLITDTSLAGEQKADGIIPAHAGVLQVSRNRWVIFLSTLDPNGWDAVKSILYQVRADAPDGALVAEGIVSPSLASWQPVRQNESYAKRCGMPVAFGVPKGACDRGRVFPHHNHFVVKWYVRAFPGESGQPLACREERFLRLEWMQFRLNATDDDLEIIKPPALMTQNGFEGDAAVFCALGPGYHMNQAMVPPLPLDPLCQEWIEFDTFIKPGQGSVAPVRYRFNPVTDWYEWVETGPLYSIPGRIIGEASTVRKDADWIIVCREFKPGANSVWMRTSDPFKALPAPILGPRCGGPHHVYRCADGAIRLLSNSSEAFPGRWRDPLWIWDVHPETLALSDRRCVCDARQAGLPFYHPGLDMAKLSPPQGNRQLVLFRTITLRQTAALAATKEPPVTSAEQAAAGIHYAEIQYDRDYAQAWDF